MQVIIAPGLVVDQGEDELAKLRADNERLRRELDESRKATVSVQAHLTAELDSFRRELLNRADTILELTAKVHDRTTLARRNAAALLVTLDALRVVVNAVHSANGCAPDGVWPPGMQKAVSDACEVLLINSIPF